MTPAIARFCTSTDWVLPAHRHLFGPRALHVRRRGDAWLALAEGPLMQFVGALQPMDALWCFSCPLVGPDPRASVDLLEDFLEDERPDARLVLLGGIPWDSDLHRYLRRGYGGRWQVHALPGTDCLQASLAGGAEGFLSRRSGKFRAGLRRSERAAQASGVEFELVCDHPDAAVLFARLLAVEQESWKWQAGESIFQTESTRAFYEELIARACAAGRLRVAFARREGVDIGFAFGANFGGVFRGLQMSYHRDHAALAPGNLCQWALIRECGREGVELYDLGMDIDYKARWAEHRLRLITLLMVRA
jgi:CelD/BcsL family acetyltransferase involved in cellulose biosynthesis